MLYTLTSKGTMVVAGTTLTDGAIAVGTIETREVLTLLGSSSSSWTMTSAGQLIPEDQPVTDAMVMIGSLMVHELAAQGGTTPGPGTDPTNPGDNGGSNGGGSIPAVYPATTILPTGVSFTRVRASFIEAILDTAGVTDEDIQAIARLSQSNGNVKANPRPVSEADALAILEAAF